jgi:RNA polymerase sigma-70 factor (ECF subfamily)
MLDGVQSGDPVDWNRFALHCQRVIAVWCCGRNVSQVDREDIVQQSLLVVVMKVHQFRRAGRGSLRAWLRAIAWRCRCEAVSRSESAQQLQDSHTGFLQASDQIRELEDEFERLSRLDLLQRCLVAVRQRVQPRTWAAFQLTALENMAGAAVAEQLGLSLEAVYRARWRVVAQLRIEWRRLCKDSECSMPSVLVLEDGSA